MELRGTAKKIEEVVIENLPHIFTGVATIGVFTTAIEASKAAVKIKEIDENVEDDRKASAKAKAIFKLFIPTFVSGAITVGSAIASDVIHTKRYASLFGALVVAKSELPKYKKTVSEVVGLDKGKEIDDKHRQAAAEANIASAGMNKNKRYKVVDQVTGHTFKASWGALKTAETYVASQVSKEGRCTLESFYAHATDEYDAPDIADRIYWSNEGGYNKPFAMDLVIDGAVDPDDGEPYYLISYEYDMR